MTPRSVRHAESPSSSGATAVVDGVDGVAGSTGLNLRGLLVAGVVAVIGGATIWVSSGLNSEASGESIGPAWWPTVLGGLIVLGAATVAVAALRYPEPMEDQRVSGHGLVRLVAVIALIVVYGISWQYFHFVLVTGLFLSALVFITGGRGVRALMLFPAVTTVVLYGLFALLLRVPL